MGILAWTANTTADDCVVDRIPLSEAADDLSPGGMARPYLLFG
jgi:hypothetical protein